uniref:Uncharacterized protein n=1 Tax=Rhizophora mucronata TaxID=61149 RepID=A0A2P2PN98_RHIMU
MRRQAGNVIQMNSGPERLRRRRRKRNQCRRLLPDAYKTLLSVGNRKIETHFMLNRWM